MSIQPSDILLDRTGRRRDRRRRRHRSRHRCGPRGLRGLGRHLGAEPGDAARRRPAEIGALGITTDVRDSAQVDAALARTIAELGPVRSSSTTPAGCSPPRSSRRRENGWDALYRANLRHVLLCTQRVARAMVDAGSAAASRASPRSKGVRAAPGYAAYAAAKAGVINYTKTAALELAPYGIRVNALAPDITLTEGHRGGRAAGLGGALRFTRADGPGRPRRRDGRRRGVPGLGPGELHHRPDDPRRRRHPRRRRLVPPPEDRGVLAGPHRLIRQRCSIGREPARRSRNAPTSAPASSSFAAAPNTAKSGRTSATAAPCFANQRA